MNELLITEAAEADYTETLVWYARRSHRAAKGFEREFVRSLEAIAENPDGYPRCDDRHHFYLLKKYPFQVIYRKTQSGEWIIVAVAHSRRNPTYWKSR